MGHLLLTISTVLSVLAWRCWARLLTPWLRRRKMSGDLADMSLVDWPELIGLLLPRKARRVWNVLFLWAVVLMFGTPHYLVLWEFFRSHDIDPWLYAHYAWTLAYWLLLLGFPAMLIAQHRLS